MTADRDVLREAVIAVVASPHRRPRRPNRNPLYRPDPAFLALATFTGWCEQIRSADVRLAMSGFVDEAHRLREIETMEAALRKIQEALEIARTTTLLP